VLPSQGGLFSSYEPISAKLSAPLTKLFSFRQVGHSNFKDHPVNGTLTIGEKTYPVKLTLKGYSSAIMCPFPKIEFKIMGHDKHDPLFEEARSFDLNTHCASPEQNTDSAFRASFYNHREAVLYRILDILQIPTYRARPAYFRYRDEDQEGSDYGATFEAFFLEDAGAFMERLNAQEIRGIADPDKDDILKRHPEKENEFQFKSINESPEVDSEDAARIALFQYMIGNYDWFIKVDADDMRSAQDFRNLWNTKIVAFPDGKWVMFPQDFNLSTAITGVKKPTNYEKVFQNVSQKSQEKIKKMFLDKKSEILSMKKYLDTQGRIYFDQSVGQFFK
jgi:hypothetical protein